MLFPQTFICSDSIESKLKQTAKTFNNLTPTHLSIYKLSPIPPSKPLFHSPLSLYSLLSLLFTSILLNLSLCLLKHVFSFKQCPLTSPMKMRFPSSIPRVFMVCITRSFYCLRFLSFHVSASSVLYYECFNGRDHTLDFFALCFTYNLDYFSDYCNNSGDILSLFMLGRFCPFLVSNANCHKILKFIISLMTEINQNCSPNYSLQRSSSYSTKYFINQF